MLIEAEDEVDTFPITVGKLELETMTDRERVRNYVRLTAVRLR